MLKPMLQTDRDQAASAGPGDAGTQQPPLPCLIEYMARNEYWLGEPEVLRALFARAESGEAWAQYSAGQLCFEGAIVPPDEDGAEKWWRLAAEQGHPMAQRWLGELYASRQIKRGGGDSKAQRSADHDLEQARVWLGQAAQQGVVEAMGMRGSLESDGREALPWFCMGAERGDMDCMYAAGELCAGSQPEVRNGEEAVQWFRLAAERGHAEAPFLLGRLHEEGTLVAQNLEEAARWYRVGAEKGHEECRYRLGKMLLEGRGVSVDLVEAEHWLEKVAFDVHDAWALLDKMGVYDRKFREYEERALADCADRIAMLMPAAEGGDAEAQFELGEIYRRHYIKEQAIAWHWKAASRGREDSKTILLNIFEYYRCSTNERYIEAKNGVKELAERGNARAQYLIADGEDRSDAAGNYSESYKYWMSKSAEQGYPEAQYDLAEAGGIDDEGAFDLYAKAALSGHIPSQLRVAECHFKGKGTKADLEAALEWAKRAVKNAKEEEWYESTQAQTLLGNIYEAQGTERGNLEAVACYSDAAARCAPEANSALGRMYEEGRGVEQDHAEACRRYMVAMKRDLGLEANREQCFLKLFLSIQWHAGREIEICKQDAERGDSNAQVEYGMRIFGWGNCHPGCHAETAQWFRLSADQGNLMGQYCHGRMMCMVSRSWSHPVAMQMFRHAAKCGLAEAQTAIAQYYRERADYSVAVRWYRMAAEQGEYAALVAMGEMSFRGEGLPQDHVAAAKWFRQALEWDKEAWAQRTWGLLGRGKAI